MINRFKSQAVALFAATVFCTSALAQQAVIPGAFGFGMDTPAGRGGDIIRVTNLADSGSGSLRNCINASGPRICVFEVSGTIQLASQLNVSNPNLTIAGQTAPDPGIMLRGATLAIKTSDVLVQHIALRAGDEEDGARLHERHSLKVNGDRGPIKNVVVDHCSVSWGVNENSSIWGEFDNVTFSNNIFAYPLRGVFEADSQGYGTLIDATDGRVSLIGNLYANTYNRNPLSGAGNFVFVNNVVYNTNTNVQLRNQNGLTSDNSIVGNTFIDGPAQGGQRPPISLAGTQGGNQPNEILPGTRLYVADNLQGAPVSDQWSLVENASPESRETLEVLTAPIWPAGLTALPTANDVVRDNVLDNAGARPAARDVVDLRILADVRNGTGQFINCVSGCESSAGGWPQRAENQRTLDVPGNPNGDDDGDGYTNVEEWLHAMAAEVEGGSGFSQPPDGSAPVKPNPPELVGGAP